jgi:glucose-1-phosphate thymidylyltransferase
MKGVILAGGNGTRLKPFTKVINKHLLPVYNKPMVYYPIETMVDAGINDILVVTGGIRPDDFQFVLDDENCFENLRINFTYQEKADGVASALAKARDFVGQDKFLVLLGDNILQKGLIKKSIDSFASQEKGCRVFLKEVDHHCESGYAIFDGDRIVEIVEKPKTPPSDMIVIGVYLYHPDVFEIIAALKPSDRGEYEITAVNNVYARRNSLQHEVFPGWWVDAGESLHRLWEAGNLVTKQQE